MASSKYLLLRRNELHSQVRGARDGCVAVDVAAVDAAIAPGAGTDLQGLVVAFGDGVQGEVAL